MAVGVYRSDKKTKDPLDDVVKIANIAASVGSLAKPAEKAPDAKEESWTDMINKEATGGAAKTAMDRRFELLKYQMPDYLGRMGS